MTLTPRWRRARDCSSTRCCRTVEVAADYLPFDVDGDLPAEGRALRCRGRGEAGRRRRRHGPDRGRGAGRARRGRPVGLHPRREPAEPAAGVRRARAAVPDSRRSSCTASAGAIGRGAMVDGRSTADAAGGCRIGQAASRRRVGYRADGARRPMDSGKLTHSRREGRLRRRRRRRPVEPAGARRARSSSRPVRRDASAVGAAPEARCGARRPSLPAAAPQAERRSAGRRRARRRRLAEVQRVRQFFPETWIWETFDTDAERQGDAEGRRRPTASRPGCSAPSRSRRRPGSAIAEASCKVLQPFFVQRRPALLGDPRRGVPGQLALYNYGAQAERLHRSSSSARDWFDLLGGATSRRSRVAPSDVGAAPFTIRPAKLGVGKVKVTARSAQTRRRDRQGADRRAGGRAREVVENLVLTAPARSRTLGHRASRAGSSTAPAARSSRSPATT